MAEFDRGGILKLMVWIFMHHQPRLPSWDDHLISTSTTQHQGGWQGEQSRGRKEVQTSSGRGLGLEESPMGRRTEQHDKHSHHKDIRHRPFPNHLEHTHETQREPGTGKHPSGQA
jgi:hypothetical protein